LERVSVLGGPWNAEPVVVWLPESVWQEGVKLLGGTSRAESEVVWVTESVGQEGTMVVVRP